MKKILLTQFILFLSLTLLAQGSGLTFTQTSGAYTPITGGTVLISGVFDDDNFAVTLPTAFTFKGVNYTQVTANTNGWISLGSTAPSNTTYTAVSSTATVPGFIAPFSLDLENADGGTPELRWEQLGNEIIFQWKDVKRYTSATNTEIFNFQLRLNTASGEMQFVYGSFLNVTTSTIAPQVGIRAESNTYPTNIYNRLVNTIAPSNTWATSIAGTANNSTCRFTATSPAASPVSGQTYIWTPVDCTSLTCTSNISPVNGSTLNANTVTLNWNTVSGSPFYKLYFGTTLPLTLQGTYSGTTATINNLLINTNYSWYVAPASFNCETAGCSLNTTTFNTGCVACVSNIAPASGSTIKEGSTVFTWNAAPGATGYNLYLGTTNPPALLGSFAGTTTTQTLVAGTYFWYVVPITSCSNPTGCVENITSFISMQVPNDICQNALDFAASVAGGNVTTLGGNTEAISFPGACAGGSRDIWYKFKATATTSTLSVAGNGSPCYDPGIQAFSGTCSTLTCLGNDDAGSCTTVNTLSLTGLTPGNIYYVRIYSGSSGGGQFLMTGTNIGTTILPLKLISFYGNVQNKDAELKWKTALETNFNRFEIQRSENGLNFTTIGSQLPGNTNYRFMDTHIFEKITTAFYRLKMIDNDSRFTYSNIIKLSKQASGALTVYPNPVRDALTINGLKQNGTMLLYNAEGRLLQQQTVSAQTITIDMSKYAKGIYLLQYKTEKEVVTQKIIKQ